MWTARQAIAGALLLSLGPAYPWLWWSLVVIVPLASWSLIEILRTRRLVDRGRMLDEKLRQLSSR